MLSQAFTQVQDLDIRALEVTAFIFTLPVLIVDSFTMPIYECNKFLLKEIIS